jgi:hypothetical protein
MGETTHGFPQSSAGRQSQHRSQRCREPHGCQGGARVASERGSAGSMVEPLWYPMKVFVRVSYTSLPMGHPHPLLRTLPKILVFKTHKNSRHLTESGGDNEPFQLRFHVNMLQVLPRCASLSWRAHRRGCPTGL